MNNLSAANLAIIQAGGESVHVDIGQFIGAYAKSLTDNLHFGPFTGTVAFFEALVYAISE